MPGDHGPKLTRTLEWFQIGFFSDAQEEAKEAKEESEGKL